MPGVVAVRARNENVRHGLGGRTEFAPSCVSSSPRRSRPAIPLDGSTPVVPCVARILSARGPPLRHRPSQAAPPNPTASWHVRLLPARVPACSSPPASAENPASNVRNELLNQIVDRLSLLQAVLALKKHLDCEGAGW